jgi:hypothetical protein
MSRSSASADSVLSIDVGTINTRAALFDVVDGRYRQRLMPRIRISARVLVLLLTVYKRLLVESSSVQMAASSSQHVSMDLESTRL